MFLLRNYAPHRAAKPGNNVPGELRPCLSQGTLWPHRGHGIIESISDTMARRCGLWFRSVLEAAPEGVPFRAAFVSAQCAQAGSPGEHGMLAAGFRLRLRSAPGEQSRPMARGARHRVPLRIARPGHDRRPCIGRVAPLAISPSGAAMPPRALPGSGRATRPAGCAGGTRPTVSGRQSERYTGA